MIDDFDSCFGLYDTNAAESDGRVKVPPSLWKDITDFFANEVRQCKDCLKGNIDTCWRSGCSAFRYRTLARRIFDITADGVNLRLPNHVKIENEILAILAKNGAPMYPSCIILESTRSKANKHTAINRLVRDGRVVETIVNSYTRMISLPNKEPENERTDNDTDSNRHSAGGGTTARKLGAGSSDARRNHRAEQPLRQA